MGAQSEQLSRIQIGGLNRLQTDQNYIAMFGKAGWKILKNLFDPCCSILKTQVYCIDVNSVKTSICNLVYPLTFNGSKGLATFNNLSDLIAYFQGHTTNSVVTTDGCNLIVFYNPSNPPALTETVGCCSDCIGLNTPYGYGGGIGDILV